MEWIAWGSIILNVFFICSWFLNRNQLNKTMKHLKQIIKGESQSLLKLSGNRKQNQLIKEINQLIEKLIETNVRYGRMMEDNKRMVSSISHDFRTPLTSMLGYIQILKKEAYTADEEKYFSIIEERTKMLSQLVEEFYTLSLLDSDEYKLSFQRVNPIILIQEQLALYYDELNQTFEKVDVSIDETVLSIQTSPQDVKRIIGNLVKNAFQHGTGYFSVQSKISDDCVQFLFQNEVKRPEKIEVERIFDRLYRGDESRKSGSTGLGLSIAQQLARRLRMNLEAELKENRLCFTLTIPIEEWKIRHTELPEL